MENLNAAGPGIDRPANLARRNPGAVMKRIKLSAILLALAATPSWTENYMDWRSSATITINTTASGANLTGTVAKFPLLVRLDARHAEVFANSKDNGTDIRFIDSTGMVRFPHQIERWDKQNQKAEFWVLLDEVPAQSHMNLRMLWNNPAAVSVGSANQVFNNESQYKDVWHMGTPGGGTAPAYPRYSAVNGGKELVPMGNAGVMAIKTVEGIAGPADSLRGNGRGTGFIGDHFAINTSTYQIPGRFSISMWVKPAANRQSHLFDIGNPDGGGSTQNIWMGQTQDNRLAAQTYTGAPGQTDGAVITPDTWQHLVYTLTEGGDNALYRNGVLVKSFSGNSNSSFYRSKNYLGRSGTLTDSTFRGILDEVTVSDVARDADWVRLSYATQKPGANAVALNIVPSQMYAKKLTLQDDHHYNSAIFERGEVILDPAEGYRQTTIEYVGEVANNFKYVSLGTGGVYGSYAPTGYDQNMNYSLTTYGLTINDNINYGGGRTTSLDATTLSTTNVNAQTVSASMVQASEMVVTPKWQSWPDYVFSADHKALSLPEIEAYIQANNRLPDMPSAREVGEKGVGLGEMNIKLLKTVEELTLHVIALDKQLKAKSSLDR